MKFNDDEFKLVRPDGQIRDINANIDYFVDGKVVIQCNTPLTTQERSQFVGEIFQGGGFALREIEYFEKRPQIDQQNQFAQFAFKQDTSGQVVESRPIGEERELGTTAEFIQSRLDSLGKAEAQYFSGQQWAIDNSMSSNPEFREQGRREHGPNPNM